MPEPSTTPAATAAAPGRQGEHALNSSWLNCAAVKKASFLVSSTPDTTWSCVGKGAGAERVGGIRWDEAAVRVGRRREGGMGSGRRAHAHARAPAPSKRVTSARLDEAADGLAISGHDVLLVRVHDAVALRAPVLVLRARAAAAGRA